MRGQARPGQPIRPVANLSATGSTDLGDRAMRIAQIAPLFEAVPPKLYGGTERVVSWLTEELVAMGHDVTLFASGDSVTKAKLEPTWPQALRLDPTILDWFSTYYVML